MLMPKIGERGRISCEDAMVWICKAAKYHGKTARECFEAAVESELLLPDGSKLKAIRHGYVKWYHRLVYKD
jgi:hypothetical protein